MTKTQLKEKYKIEVKKIVKQIKEKYEPEKIILFGSFVYGILKPWSDIDLLIIKNTKKKKVERIKEVLMKTKSELPIEPLVYTPKEIQNRLDLGDFFFQNIIKRGKLVYEK